MTSCHPCLHLRQRIEFKYVGEGYCSSDDSQGLPSLDTWKFPSILKCKAVCNATLDCIAFAHSTTNHDGNCVLYFPSKVSRDRTCDSGAMAQIPHMSGGNCSNGWDVYTGMEHQTCNSGCVVKAPNKCCPERQMQCYQRVGVSGAFCMM